MAPLLTSKQVARLLGWNPASLAVMKCRGTLPFPFVQLGRSIRYRPEDLAAYLAARTVGPRPRK